MGGDSRGRNHGAQPGRQSALAAGSAAPLNFTPWRRSRPTPMEIADDGTIIYSIKPPPKMSSAEEKKPYSSRSVAFEVINRSIHIGVPLASEKPPPEWTSTVKDSLVASPANSTRREFQPTIFRVPDNIRNCDPSAYTPQLVSIGPYHRGSIPKSDLTDSLQNYKSWCVRFLLSRKTGGHEAQACDLLANCLGKMEELDPIIRSCYSADNIGFTDRHELAELMLLDGCFVLTRLLDRARGPTEPNNKGKEAEIADNKGIVIHVEEDDGMSQGPLLGMLWIWKLVEYDLLMLENQIPFFVLQVLFHFLATPEDSKVGLTKRALNFFNEIRPTSSISFQPQGEYLHLLHLFYSSLLPSDKMEPVKNIVRSPFSQEWMPNATDLRNAGVAFKENKKGESFLDIAFQGGTLMIPSLCVSDYSNSLFRNLIAFEQCYPHTFTMITTYCIFMDCLVDVGEDVKLLDLKGILVNRLSTDEAVADLFNKLTLQVHYALDRNYLHNVFVALNKYHQSMWQRHRAHLMRDYFGSPWSILSVIAAVTLLLLTGLQTFYTVYAYHHPR